MAAIIAALAAYAHDLIAGRSSSPSPELERPIIDTSSPSPLQAPKSDKNKDKDKKGKNDQNTVVSYPDNIPFTDDDPCASCEKGCDHPQLPPSLQKLIEYGEPLLGTMKPYALHACIIEGSSSNWPERIEEDSSTITAQVMEIVSKIPTNYRILVSAIDISYTPSDLHISPEQASGKGVDIMIFPHKWILRGIKLNQIEGVLNNLVSNKKVDDTIRVEKLSDDDVFVFVCTHKKRDRRCGVAGPLLIDEFCKALQEKKDQLGAYKIHVCGISHIGGHKFAGNLIIYAPKTHGDWYGRVKSCHVRLILEETILEGKVFKSLWRGQMSSTPSLSW